MPRILIIGVRASDLSIEPLLVGYHREIVDNAVPDQTEPGDLAIVPLTGRHPDLHRQLDELHDRGARAVVFAAQSEDDDTRNTPGINAITAIDICTDHHCFDVILGNSNKQFLERQVEEAMTGLREKKPRIKLPRRVSEVFVAMPYQDRYWDRRYRYYLKPALRKKGIEPLLASDEDTVETLGHMREQIDGAQFLIACLGDERTLECTYCKRSGQVDFFSNGSVCFEAGIAVQLNKPVVIVTPESCPRYEVPTDMHGFGGIRYANDMHLALQVGRQIDVNT